MISLNYRDSRPIYEQIKDGLRKLIVTGALGTGEKLPSVRALATQLSINPTPSSGPTTSWRARATFIPSPARAASPPETTAPMRAAGEN